MRSLLALISIVFFQVVSLDANCQDNYSFFKNKFDNILRENPGPLNDEDGDGIDDPMEKKLGTMPSNPDTDGDGLDDYLEIFKYKTNPLNRDSDGDGKDDSIWSERFEYTHVLKIVAQVGKPCDVSTMNSFSLDARTVKHNPDGAIIEYIVYPSAEPYLVPLTIKGNTEFLKDYLMTDTLTRLSGNQSNEILNVIQPEKSDLEKTILLIAYIWENYELKDELFSQCEPLMEIRVTNDKIIRVHSGWSPPELLQKYDFQTILNLNCISDEMVKNKSRGACGSTATLLAAIFKNAGIPVRMKQNFPFVTNKDSSQVVLLENLKDKSSIPDQFSKGMYGDNHFFNEIFINGHWIDLDTYRLGNKWQNKPYLKSIHFNNWSDVDFANTWEPWTAFDKKSAASLTLRYKAYKTLSLEEIPPRYPSGSSP